MSEHLKAEHETEFSPAVRGPVEKPAASLAAASAASSETPAAPGAQPGNPAEPQARGGPAEVGAGGSKRPRRGRVAIEFAECSLGEIMNVSPTGLRARYKGSRKNLPEVDQRFGMQVQTPDGPVQVRARVAWTKRVGLRTFDIGVQFVAADDKDTVKLKQLAAMAGRSIVINETTGGAHLRAG